MIDNLHNNILCPMHMRMYDIKVNEITNELTDNPTDQTYSIVMYKKGETLLIQL